MNKNIIEDFDCHYDQSFKKSELGEDDAMERTHQKEIDDTSNMEDNNLERLINRD